MAHEQSGEQKASKARKPTRRELAALARVTLREQSEAPKKDSRRSDLRTAERHSASHEHMLDETSGHSEPTNLLPGEERVSDGYLSKKPED